MVMVNHFIKDNVLYVKFNPSKTIIPSFRNKNDLVPIVTEKDIDLLQYFLPYEKYKVNGHEFNKYALCEYLKEQYNNIRKELDFDYLFSFTYLTNSNVINKLKKYFNEEQLNLIEEIILNDNKLMDFQKVSIIYYLHKLFNRNSPRILIGDDRGLGKSLQSLKISQVINKYPVLIICPAYLRLNWYDEIKKHLQLEKDTFIISDSKKIQFINKTNKKYYIVSYELFPNNTKLVNELIRKDVKTIILDEIHYIKNQDSKRTKNIIKVINKLNNPHIIGLSGTPIWNKPEDVYTIFDLIYPGIFRNRNAFMKKYCKMEFQEFRRNGKKVNVPKIISYRNLDDLGAKFRILFMIRRTKQKVLDQLPSKMRTKIFVEIDEREIMSLNADIYRLLDRIANYRDQNLLEFFSSLSNFNKLTGLYKIPYCVKFIEDLVEEGINKIVVFFYHREVGETLQSELNKKEIGNVLYIGGLNDKERKQRIDEFYNNDKCYVFLGSIRACGLGINLTNSNTCIFVENDYTPTWHLQAEDRLHRIGTKNNVNIYYLTVKDTIDEYMVDYIIEKSKMLDQVLHEHGENTIEFDRNDFLKYLKNK